MKTHLNVLLCLLLLFLNLGLACHLVWGERGLLAFQEHKAIKAGLEQRLQRVKAENVDLSRRIRLLKANQTYQELIVRQELHLVGENEILYLANPSSEPGKRSGWQERGGHKD